MASDTTTLAPLRGGPARQSADVAAGTALTLLAAGVRLPTLAQQSFWLDEGYTERLLRMSLGGMLHAIPRIESTPPLYYALAWVWTRLFGYSELALRSLSALAGIATIPVAYAVARRLSGRRAAVLAGLLLALAPVMVWFSQEARAYALATLLSTITLLCTVAYLEDDRTGWLVGWAVASALGLATHYFVVFVVAPELVLLLWLGRPLRRLMPAIAFVLVAAAALTPLALAQRGTGHADYIAQSSLSTRLLQVPKQLVVGYASPDQPLTAGLAAVAVLAGAVWPLIASRGTAARARIPLVVGACSLLGPAALAVLGVDFLNTRNLLPALPPLYVAAAIGFAAGTGRHGRGAFAGALALISIAVLVLVDVNPRYQRDDWRGASQALGAPGRARAILISPGSGLIPLQIYQHGLGPLSQATRVTELDIVAIPRQITGYGIATPPHPARPVPVPAGFQFTRAVYGRTYTVLGYRSATPITVGPALAGGDYMGLGSYLPLLQRDR